MVIFPFEHQPKRLVARRRSRCWKCDQPMQHRPKISRSAWWCAKCAHVVTYISEREAHEFEKAHPYP